MNLLQRATQETLRQLGMNFPKAVMAILGIGLSIAFVAMVFGLEVSPPETESFKGFLLWILRSLAWVGALVAVFVPLLLLNIFKVARQDRSTREKLAMAAETADLVGDQMKSFLRNTLSNPSYGVVNCYAFGSVVAKYPMRDVDVIIQFNSSERKQVRIYRERLRNIESSFQEFHGLKLHVQTFLSAEDDALENFLNRAGAHERIL